MKPKNTWMLVLLAAALFAFIYFFERHIVPKEPEVRRLIPGLDTNAVTSIEIQPHGQFPIRVERVSGGWQLTKPIVYPVRGAAVDQLLDALAGLSPQRHISPEELQNNKKVSEDYGFDTPQSTIIIEQGDYAPRVEFGNFTPPGDGIYTRVIPGPGIDIIGAAFAGIVPTNDYQWRDTSFVNLQGMPFVELDVNGPNGQLHFQRDDPGQPWTMSQPIRARADNAGINFLLDRLQSLSVVQFKTDDSNADLDLYGLQTPSLTLSFKDKNTNQLLLVQFGKSPPDNTNLIYAHTNSSSTIVLVERDDLRPWNADSSGFRDPHLFSLTISEPPASLECYGPDGRTNFLVQSTNGLLIVSDGQGRRYLAETNVVAAAVQQLAGMKVVPWSKDRVADDAVGEPELPGMGLAPNPIRRYVLRAATPTNGSEAPVIAQVDFGGPNTNHEGTICARRSDLPAEQTVFAVNASDVDRLPYSAPQLRILNIWNFESTNIGRLTLQADGQTKEWKHLRKYLWQPLAGGITDDKDPRGMYMENLGDVLGSLTAEAWVGPAEPTAEYGFGANSIQLSVTLTNVSPPQPLTVTFGGIVPGGGGAHYACTQMENENWIFIYSLKDWKELMDSLPKDN
jgi:Domain of unknown function (DUF4340)